MYKQYKLNLTLNTRLLEYRVDGVFCVHSYGNRKPSAINWTFPKLMTTLTLTHQATAILQQQGPQLRVKT